MARIIVISKQLSFYHHSNQILACLSDLTSLRCSYLAMTTEVYMFTVTNIRSPSSPKDEFLWTRWPPANIQAFMVCQNFVYIDSLLLVH